MRHFYQESCNCQDCCAMRRGAYHTFGYQERAKIILVAGLISMLVFLCH